MSRTGIGAVQLKKWEKHGSQLCQSPSSQQHDKSEMPSTQKGLQPARRPISALGSSQLTSESPLFGLLETYLYSVLIEVEQKLCRQGDRVEKGAGKSFL